MAAVVAVETATALGCAGYGILDRTSVAGVLATRGAISSSSSSSSSSSAPIGHIPSFPPAEGGMAASRMTTARTGMAAAMSVAPARPRTTSLHCLTRRRFSGPSLPHYTEDSPVVVGLGSALGSISHSRGWRRDERGEGPRPAHSPHVSVSSFCPGKGEIARGCSYCCGFGGGDCLRRQIGSCCAMAVGGVSDRGRRRRLSVRGFFVRAAADVELELADRDGGNAMTMADGEDVPTSSSSPSSLSSPSSSSSPSDLASSMAEDDLGLSSRAVELGVRVAAAVEMQTQMPVTMAKKGKQEGDEEKSLNDNRSSWLKERRRQRNSQQATYQFAAIASTIGFATLAAAAVWYRFIFQLEGNALPYNEVLGTFALAVGAAVGMEFWARWAHKSLWHDSLWSMHESHHRPRDGPFELNDVFAIINAGPAIALMSYGFFHKGLIPGLCFGAGLGITLFGIAYMFVHDGLVHKRFPVGPIADLPYLKRVAAAHQLHHADKFEGVPFGLFLGPQELAEVGGLPDLEELLKARQGKAKGL